MIKITQRQIEVFDAVALEQFLKKVVGFLQQEIPDEMSRIAEPLPAVRAAYNRAKRAGHKTERAIVQFILDDITHKSS